ncbi:MAG: FG-GAP repeat domain-containing protein [Spirochaetota bacterium]
MRRARRPMTLLAAALATALLVTCNLPFFGGAGPRALLEPPPGRYDEAIYVHPRGESGERYFWTTRENAPLTEFEELYDLQIAGDTVFWYYAIDEQGLRSPIIEAEYVIDDESGPDINPRDVWQSNSSYYGYVVRWSTNPPGDADGDGTDGNPVDDLTNWSDLEYSVFSSDRENIASLSAAEADGRLEMSWRREQSSYRYAAGRPGERRVVNVFVRDLDGNVSSYGSRVLFSRSAPSVYTGYSVSDDRIYLHESLPDTDPTYAEFNPVGFSNTKAVFLNRYDNDSLADLAIVRDDGPEDVYELYLTLPNATWPVAPYREFFREPGGTARRRIIIAQMDGTGPREVVYNTVGGAIHVEQVEETATIVISAQAEYFTVGDLDNDGLTDIVAINETPGTEDIRVFLNEGTSFAEYPAPLSGGLPPGLTGAPAGQTVDVELADIDRDGMLDLIVALPGAGLPDPSVQLYLGNGDGSFTDVVGEETYWTLDYDTVDVVPADFDRDGDVDLFFANSSDGSLVFTNLGDGTFMAGPQTGTAFAARSAVGADLNGDGLIDIVEDYAAEAPRVWFNQDGTSIAAGPVLGADTTTAIAVGQVR